MQVLDVSELERVSEPDALEVEAQYLRLLDHWQKDQLAQVFQFVMWLKVKDRKVL
jgi:hypothetical protein